jgi:ankyrin repeat protein
MRFLWHRAVFCISVLCLSLTPIGVFAQIDPAEMAANRAARQKEIEEMRTRIGPQERALLDAVQAGDLEKLKAALAAGANPNVQDPDSRDIQDGSPLMFAAERGDTAAGRALLERGANPELISYDLFVPAIYFAAARGHLEFVKLLVARRVKLEEIDGYQGGTALWRAAANGHLDVVVYLASAGANVRFVTEFGKQTTLHAVAGHSGSTTVADFLLRKGVPINAQDHLGRTALMDAVENKNVDLVRFLVRAGARRDLKDSAGQTALQIAEALNNPEITAALAERPAR